MGEMTQAIVYITIEYCQADLFSGNGVCARSQVRHLSASSVRVHVICGRPSTPNVDDEPHPNISITAIPLATWFSTDRASSHTQFARGAARVLQSLNWKNYDACLAVDWTGTNPLFLLPHDCCFRMRDAAIPILYLNFRSYMSMTNISEDDRAFYTAAERDAVHLALRSHGGIVSLCDADDAVLRSLVPSQSDETPEDQHLSFKVLLPMLRSELATIAYHERGKILNPDRKRTYITSLVRLSEDKGPHRFVSLLRRMQKDDPDIWEQTGVVPLLLGAPSQPEYAARVCEDLKRAVPHAVIIDSFLPPNRLADVLQHAVVNIHPALYEAYGLTIIEAAAMGCPSVINRNGIGAAQLLDPAVDAAVVVDMEDEQAVADTVRRLIFDSKLRNHVAHQAFLYATSWTESEYVRALLDFTNERVQEAKSKLVEM